jgi:hypothetical protein
MKGDRMERIYQETLFHDLIKEAMILSEAAANPMYIALK